MKTLFVSLDTVGADRLAMLGSNRGSTPNLDRLATASALFTQAYATDIPTQPSHTAVFTGRSGVSTGIVSHFHPPAMLAEETAWLPAEFRRRGHHTGAVDHLFAMKKWFSRGYDDYLVPPGRSRSPASVINEIAFPWLEQHRREDFFLFLHYWDAHIPYVPPEPFRSEYTAGIAARIDPALSEKLRSRPSYPLFKRNLYDHLGAIPSIEYIEALHDAEIAYLDYELGRLFQHLEAMGILDECMLVIFGDHGEIMTEHDAWFDHAGLYDSVVHVPLMIRAPGLVPAARIDSMVALVDLMPTVLELQGFGPLGGADAFDGLSLAGLMDGRAAQHRDAIMLSECTWQAKRGIRTCDWKYISCRDPGIYPRAGPELYDLHADPLEQHNLASRRPDVVAEMDSRLRGWVDERLGDRPDPMLEVLEVGLPAVRRLEDVIDEDARAAALRSRRHRVGATDRSDGLRVAAEATAQD